MDGTPRLRSAFPSTPRTTSESTSSSKAASKVENPAVSPQQFTTSTAKATRNGPVIPLDIVDAPQQRLYVVACYLAIHAWRFWDYAKLLNDDADSLWLFLKWTFIDGFAIYGLPSLRVPWLEWSTPTMTILFLAHALLDGFLMFRIPIPFMAWLGALSKVFYDRELAVLERSVKPADVLHNASLILGKQTIHILPEGSAMLNPDQNSFCLDSTTTFATLPIRINQTSPILIEILRFDLDNGLNETITIQAKQARAMKKQADRIHPKSDFASPRYLHLPVKKTGLYRLHRVVDESKLEVQRRVSDTLIVRCPHASIKVVPPDKCRGELSDLVLDVYGAPPLKIKYSRVVNRDDKIFSFQSIQPENLDSPPNRQRGSDAPASRNNVNVSWARAQHIRVPLNESMNIAGRWVYSIDEVHDASGNVADYTSRHQTLELPKGEQLQQFFHVHERPRASLDTYESQCVLRVARGKGARFPIKIETEGAHQPEGPYPLSYSFTPLDKLQSNGEHEMGAKVEDFQMSTSQDRPILTSPGLYTLRSVSSQFCGGEVLEPASCLLTNPPQPNLSVSSENLFDKCAGNAIGLRVDLDLIGTPPFQVQYDVLHKNHGKAQVHTIRVDSLRHQIEFRPREAGRHIYTFRSIEDSVYDQRALVAKNTVLEQDVKPPASAHFTSSRPKKHACIEEPVSFDVRLQGEGPWDLEYELVHAGKRKKKRISGIEQEIYTIKTDNLVDGGEYVVALTSIQDRSGCKIFLNDEARIDVRQQRPKVSFGHLEGQRSTLTLEDQLVRLPVRLIGESPWTIKYRNLKDSSSSIVHEKVLRNKNDFIEVRQQGKYELLDVHDDACPGTVARTANQFEVFWIERPDFRLSDNVLVERVGDAYVKKQVCEGDEDTVEMSLVGTPPYYVKYEQRIKPQRGGVSYSNKEFTAGLGVASIRMDTSQAGLVEYRFSELGDHLYTHDSRKRQPLVIRQQVNPRPAALFLSPGKTYRYCKEEEAGDELIPIALEGTPPFYLELDIKHHSSPRPEIVRIPNIVKNTFEFRIPHRVLTFGNHVVTVRNVRDAHGCHRKTDFETPRVQVMVSNVPAISSMESREDYCIGDRISYTLSGTPPFQVFYSFEGNARRATSIGTTFRRIADSPGNYTITSIGDHASDCKARTKITKLIHPMPSVKINKGRETEVGIHEGGEAQLSFEFWGTPPFEFTYTRSLSSPSRNKPPIIQETKHEISDDYEMVISVSEEGIYEVVAIKDRYCSFSKSRGPGRATDANTKQKLLQV